MKNGANTAILMPIDEMQLPATPLPEIVTPEWIAGQLERVAVGIKFDVAAIVKGILTGKAETQAAGNAITSPDGWMECDEVAEYLKLKPKAVRYGAARGVLPGHKYPAGSIRGRWRFRKEELDEYLNRKPRTYRRKGLDVW